MKYILAILCFLMSSSLTASDACPTYLGGRIDFGLPKNAQDVIFRKEGNTSSVAFSLPQQNVVEWLNTCAPEREFLHDAEATIQEFDFATGVVVILSPTKNGAICIEIVEKPIRRDNGASAACKL